MEQATDVRSLIEQGDARLKEIEPREAAALYAQAAQQDPTAVGAHLGLAEANFALGQFPIAVRACEEVERLAPGTADAALAQAITLVIARRYQDALTQLDRVVELDPPRAYAHALRGYCLRQLRQTYDASLAESKAARLSGTHDLPKLFPPAAPPLATFPGAAGYPGAQAFGVPATPGAPPLPGDSSSARIAGLRPWSERSQMERQMARARFVTRNIPVVTYTLIAINVVAYLIGGALSGNILSPDINNPLYANGVELGYVYVQHNPWAVYRIVTAMFLHENILHIGLNMLSLFFVGIVTEQVFGHWRYLFIYMITGILAGVAELFSLNYAIVNHQIVYDAGLGASGAIFGIFGAFGAFLFLRRRYLMNANSIIFQWLFWLALNLAFTFSVPGIAIADHLGGVIAGLILGALLVPSFARGR